MLDWEGELRQPEDREKLVLADIDGPALTIASAAAIPDTEQQYINELCLLDDENHDGQDLQPYDIELASRATILSGQILHD